MPFNKISPLSKQFVCLLFPERSRAEDNTRHHINHGADKSSNADDEMKLLIPVVKWGHPRNKTNVQTHI